jgi:hypothetical protein
MRKGPPAARTPTYLVRIDAQQADAAMRCTSDQSWQFVRRTSTRRSRSASIMPDQF